MPTVQTNLRLESEIKARALAEAERRRIPLNALVEMALEALLGGGEVGSGDDGLSERLAEIESRLAALEASRLGEWQRFAA